MSRRVGTPRVLGVSMVKDEADIIGATLINLLEWGVEQLIVADNGSTDGTRDVLDALAPDVITLDDHETGYWQARKMTGLLRRAEALGAEWVIPFDADELWSPCGHASIPGELARLPGWAIWGSVPMWNHFCTADDSDDPDPTRRMRWRHTDRNPLNKVVVRAGHQLSLDMGNHRVIFPSVWQPGPDCLQIRHFPYRSEDQFVRKARNGAAAYAATDLDEDAGAHWRGYGRILDEKGEAALRDVFREHFFYPTPWHARMVVDPAPRRTGLWPR